MPHANPDATDQHPSSTVRSLISLAVLIHLIMVFIALSANFFPSRTQSRLVTAFAPYLQTFNLNLSNAYGLKLYHYTHGEPIHDDHFLEVQFDGGPRDGQTIRLPDGQWHGTANRNRYLALARTLAYQPLVNNEEFLGKLIEQGLAPYFLAGDTETRATIRVRRHAPMLRSAERGREQAPPDPESPVYYNTVYEALVMIDAEGRVSLTSVEAAGQVAPLRGEETDND